MGKWVQFVFGTGQHALERPGEAFETSNLDAVALAFDQNFLDHCAVNVDKSLLIKGRPQSALEHRENPGHRGAHRLTVNLHQGQAIGFPFDESVKQVKHNGLEFAA